VYSIVSSYNRPSERSTGHFEMDPAPRNCATGAASSVADITINFNSGLRVN
jgi:hypothetical protein